MYPYWLLFTLWAAGAVQAERRRAQDPRFLFFAAAALLTTLMIGLRFEVGGDWAAYIGMYRNVVFLDLGDALQTTDAGYAAVNWLSVQLGFGITFVNLVCATLSMGGFARLAWRLPNPALAVLVAVPYLIVVVAMGYTRQATAIGLICFAVADASEKRLIRIVVLIGIATLFHKTAILILPVILVPIFRRNAVLGAIGALTFVVLFVLLLRDSSDRLISNYAAGDYDSQGAAVRVSMNVVAAIVYILIRKRIVMSEFQKSFWLMCAILSLLSVVALLTISASSGVDRLSLYLIPIQAVAYANLPYCVRRDRTTDVAVVIGLVFYAFLVQYTWLNYANNARYWTPYSLSL